MSSLRMLGMLAVAILISAACSGGGGEVTIAEYFRLTDDLSRTKERQQEEARFEDYSRFDRPVDYTRAFFEVLARIEGEYESGLSSLQPPDELRAMHADLLDFAQQRLDAFDAIVAVLSDAGPSADMDALLEPIFPALGEAESAGQEACRALNDFALVNGVSDGDPCARVFLMEGAGMQPTAENGDVLDVHLYRNVRPQRGDMVVFDAPTIPDREFMKRIIGLPGEEIAIDEAGGGVSVNGVLLSEPYVRGSTRCGTACEVDIPDADSQESFGTCGSRECYFVMGDNRQNSSDSRQGWLVPAENINGWVTAP